MIIVKRAGTEVPGQPPPPVDTGVQGGGGYEWPTPGEVAPLVWTWTDTADQVWNLTDWSSPLVKLRGASGLGIPPFEHWWSEGGNLDGSSWEGARVSRGSLFLPLIVRGFSSQEFIETHAAFMRGLNPRARGTMRVTRPDGHWREVRARYESGGDLTMDLDPVKFRHARYGITWTLEQPFWEGEPVERTFDYEAPAPFFPGPPWNLGKSAVLGSAKVPNPGEEEVSAFYRVGGPFTSFSVGAGASLVSLTLNKAAGQWVEVDMDPRRKTIVDEGGVDRWAAATDLDFSRIPPGDAVPISTVVQGPGATTFVYVRFTPLYRGALS
jgi:hypothetical protein